MKLAGKKILVTGADGFIGSHLVEHLVEIGCEVRAMALYNSFGSRGWLDQCDEELIRKIEIVMGDVRDRGSVATAMSDCNVVFHLAALIGIPYSSIGSNGDLEFIIALLRLHKYLCTYIIKDFLQNVKFLFIFFCPFFCSSPFTLCGCFTVVDDQLFLL